MYPGSHCIALGHNLVGLWFLSLHGGFLLCIWGYARGHVGRLCLVVYITDLLCSPVVVSGCSWGLLFWIMFHSI